MSRVIGFVMLLGLCLTLPGSASAKVFYAKDEALRVAFPEADTIDKQTFFLTDEQAKQIETLARARLESKLVTVYVGRRNQKALGYALIDVHVVRTLPQASMIILSPEGRVVSTLVLAFYEPLEYLPPGRWLRQFEGKAAPSALVLGREIAGITGATLTAHAITDSVRKALALYDVLLAPKRR